LKKDPKDLPSLPGIFIQGKVIGPSGSWLFDKILKIELMLQ